MSKFTNTDNVPLTGSISQTESVSLYTTPEVPDTPLALKLALELMAGDVLQAAAPAASELRRLHEENEALVADAERYRWLVENAVIYAGNWKHDGREPASTKQPLDNAIDAARGEAT